MTDEELQKLVQDAVILELRPDDVFVLETPGPVSDEAAARIKELIGRYTTRRIMILSSGLHARVLREID